MSALACKAAAPSTGSCFDSGRGCSVASLCGGRLQRRARSLCTTRAGPAGHLPPQRGLLEQHVAPAEAAGQRCGSRGAAAPGRLKHVRQLPAAESAEKLPIAYQG